MKRTRIVAFALALAALVAGSPESAAWESTTTHAGLSEQSALASSLHQRLRESFGQDAGLLSSLIVPAGDAENLYVILRRLNPIHGYVPDARGRLSALGWLIAGSVVADNPIRFAANHFHNPWTSSGLSDATLRGLIASLREKLTRPLARPGLPHSGMSAIAWLESPENPMGLAGFADQYRKAVTARTPEERGRHLAGALLAAGAMLHVLQDLGSPSHARNDLAAHLEQLSDYESDVGSRYERVAALAYGRLGVPPVRETPSERPLTELFAGGDGLADRTARSFFSRFTMPAEVAVRATASAQTVRKALLGAARRPQPLPSRIDLIAARSTRGAVFRGKNRECLAVYKHRSGRVRFSMPDRCVVEQLAVLLPEVGGFGAALLDRLFRGRLALVGSGNRANIQVDGAPLGDGTLTVLVDDAEGARSEVARIDVKDGALPALPAAPMGSSRITLLFDGTDKDGQPLLATGTSKLPLGKR